MHTHVHMRVHTTSIAQINTTLLLPLPWIILKPGPLFLNTRTHYSAGTGTKFLKKYESYYGVLHLSATVIVFHFRFRLCCKLIIKKNASLGGY